MCCFSLGLPGSFFGSLFPRRVHVSSTNIFARFIEPRVQALVYSMNIATSREVAMVLPVPIARGAGEDAVRFVALERHPRMFSELRRLFPEWRIPLARSSSLLALPRRAPRPRLEVHEIGSFVASFVPSRRDFDRLDPRFRVPDVLFEAVPHYASFGFAVFQLAPGKKTVHPMAFTFRTRSPGRLFFPTVHVHDGTFEPTASFDHTLYYQRAWRGYPIGVDEHAATTSETYEGLVEPHHHIQRRTLRGRMLNADVWID